MTGYISRLAGALAILAALATCTASCSSTQAQPPGMKLPMNEVCARRAGQLSDRCGEDVPGRGEYRSAAGGAEGGYADANIRATQSSRLNRISDSGRPVYQADVLLRSAPHFGL